MAYKIIWSPHATQNLQDIATFIMRDSIDKEISIDSGIDKEVYILTIGINSAVVFI